MTDRRLYCDALDCDRPVSGHGSDKCSTHRRQLSRTGKCSPIAVKLTPEERALEAGIAFLDADTDQEAASRKRAWMHAMKGLGGKELTQELTELQSKVQQLDEALKRVPAELRQEMWRKRSEAVKNGLSAARARGAQIGRPRKADDEKVQQLYAITRDVSMVARILEISDRTVERRLRESDKTKVFVAGPGSPRLDGGSS